MKAPTASSSATHPGVATDGSWRTPPLRSTTHPGDDDEQSRSSGRTGPARSVGGRVRQRDYPCDRTLAGAIKSKPLEAMRGRRALHVVARSVWQPVQPGALVGRTGCSRAPSGYAGAGTARAAVPDAASISRGRPSSRATTLTAAGTIVTGPSVLVSGAALGRPTTSLANNASW